MGLSAIFGEVPVFLGFSQKKKITIRELFPMRMLGMMNFFIVLKNMTKQIGSTLIGGQDKQNRTQQGQNHRTTLNMAQFVAQFVVIRCQP